MRQRQRRKDHLFYIYTIFLVLCLNNLIIRLDAEIIVTTQGLFSNPSIISLYNPTNLQRKNLQNIINQQQLPSKISNNQPPSEMNRKNGPQTKSQIIYKPTNIYSNLISPNSQFSDAYGGITLFNLAQNNYNPNQINLLINSQANLGTQTIPIFPQQIKYGSPLDFYKDQTQTRNNLIQIKPQSYSANKMMDNIDLANFEAQLNKSKKLANFQKFDAPSFQSITNIEAINSFPQSQFPQNQFKPSDSSFPNISSRPIQYNTMISDLQKNINERFNNFFPV